MDKKEIGRKISAMRKEQRMTQKELAEKLHVTDKSVSKWETGTHFPNIAIMEDLAIALGISVAELLGLENISPEELISDITKISLEEKEEIKIGVRKRSLQAIILSAVLMIAELCAFFIASENNLSGGIYGICTLGVFPLYGYILGSALYNYVKSKHI